jgi:signal transduction histidine kinase
MAVAAGQITADDLTQRLPHLATHDELDELTRAFNTMLDRLQQGFERQSKFTGDAAHQLRTPLAAILGQVEVALRKDRSTDEYRQVLETVRRRTGHLTKIVEALLFLARANAEAIAPPSEQINVSDWLPAHLHSWSEHPRFKDFQLRNAAAPLAILAQPVLLGELLDILLDNACKYSQPGTSISIRLGQNGQVALLSVEDSGCGLDERELASVFDPFVRSAEARRLGIEGSGLGLSIAKRLAELLNGELRVESQMKQGSIFTVRLPLLQADTDGCGDC